MELFAEALILRYIYKICLLKKIRTWEISYISTFILIILARVNIHLLS